MSVVRPRRQKLSCIHQQGYQGCAFHSDAPTAVGMEEHVPGLVGGSGEGREMGAQGHLGQRPVGPQKHAQGQLEALTSGQFLALWTERVQRFMARKIEPPTQYVEHASKAKKPNVAATDEKEKKLRWRRGEHNV